MSTHVSANKLFEKVSKLQEFNDFVAWVLTLQTKRRNDTLPAEEAKLIKQINLGISSETWQRYEQLKEKRRSLNLIPKEQAELINIGNQIEVANAKRLSALAKLATLRKTSLDLLMKEFGIRTPTIE